MRCEGKKTGRRRWHQSSPGLLEPDGGGLLAEALTAEVKAVLADETSLVRALAALAGALAVLARAGEPNSVVGHFDEGLRVLARCTMADATVVRTDVSSTSSG